MRSSVDDGLRVLELPDLIADCERRINVIRGEQAALIAELDRAITAEFPDAAREEIALACRIPDGQARTRLATARALERRLSLTRDAVSRGRLSIEHAAAMARATTLLTTREAMEVEQEVLDDHRAITPGQLGFRAREAAQRVSPTTVEQRSGAVAERSLTAFRGEGYVSFNWTLPTIDAEVVSTYVTATSARQGRDDLRPGEQRRAEALLELVRSTLDAGTLPSGGDGRRPHLELMATMESLADGVSHAAQIGGRFVLSAQLRELACEADVRLSVLDSFDRTLLDQGRTTRVVSARLRAHLAVRDGHCRFPGCDVRAPRCRAHHIRHWADGGPTDVDNLLLLCERHHHAVHGGWQVRLDRHGTTWWISPTGHEVVTPDHLDRLDDPEDLTDAELGMSWIRPWWEFFQQPPPDADPPTPAPAPAPEPTVLDVCPF